MWEGFETAEIRTAETTIFVCHGGKGPPVLLLHGFPQSHLMWHGVAPILARNFTVICADLRGYGESGCPASTPDHEPYSKRAMARDMVSVMATLGHDRFALVGHDRGARVAYRLAFDHPRSLSRLALLDIVPTAINWQTADGRFAQHQWPWSLLAQSEPLPERMIQAAADAVVDSFGTRDKVIFNPEMRSAYIQTLQNLEHVHAMCEDYRAAATLDRQHDEEDQAAGRRIKCPVLLLWSANGLIARIHKDTGGHIAVWKHWADQVEGSPVNAGHFFPEEIPEETALALGRFLFASE